MQLSLFVLAASAGAALGAPQLAPRQNACFIVGKTVLPKEVSDAVTNLQAKVTCDASKKTISNVPDVTAGGVTFSSINFAGSNQSPLAFALDKFATTEPLASNDLAKFQNELNAYVATEAGIRSVGGSLAIKVPKFFLSMQVSRIQTAQGNPPAAAGQQVNHLRDKVLKNAPKENKALLDQVTALAAKTT
ncbi:hypothetical protein CORC01_13404 [Colletotrichum orchidophilum]|uniref:DUF7143 domain-containing protein n=1 Tax=Colletotrichum orchidophilum TaxID=1209926 RepID=A0A1G4AQ40_9PEZI|nr:uncharacterized protein CORC01_13404 [Colletotrichum orchidophilum]OHE91289.1 hypothetical protein CORC01_13404 [Colletotrichum orchidophilum]